MGLWLYAVPHAGHRITFGEHVDEDGIPDFDVPSTSIAYGYSLSLELRDALYAPAGGFDPLREGGYHSPPQLLDQAARGAVHRRVTDPLAGADQRHEISRARQLMAFAAEARAANHLIRVSP